MTDSNFNDLGMSPGELSDSDIERLLSGQRPESDELAELVPLVDALRDEYVRPPSEEAVQRVAVSAAALVRSDHENRLRPRAKTMPPRTRPAGLRRRLIVATAAVFLFSSLTGAALAADGAAPGDLWYGVDRAVEAVGIGAGGPVERIDEAQVLLERGELVAAVEHAATATENTSDEATAALLQTAGELKGNVGGEEVEGRIAQMLLWMAATDTSGSDFGVSVAEMARGIVPSDDPADDVGSSPDDPGREPGQQPGPPAGTPGQGPPDESPGQGPPTGTPGQGPPDDSPGQGPPDDNPGQGQSGNQGNGPPDGNQGNGPPDGNQGNGPPDGNPGQGQSGNQGNGPPDGNQGNGPPDGNQGNGPPDENPGQGQSGNEGNGPPDENPGQGQSGNQGNGPPDGNQGNGPPGGGPPGQGG